MIPIHPKIATRTLITALLAAAALTPVYAASPRDTALADAPLGYYELGTPKLPGTVINTIGNVVAGASVGVTSTASALAADPDAAAQYDGVSSLTTIPFSADYNPAPTASFSVEAWVAPSVEGGATPQVIFSSGGTTQGWKLTQGLSNADPNADPAKLGYAVSFYNGSTTPSFTLAGGAYSLGFGNHIVITYDGATKTASLYIDGSLAQQKSTALYAANTSAPLTLGGDSAGTHLFNGAIDEFAFYKKALTASQVSAHTDNGFSNPPAQSYSSLITTDGAALYLRLDEKDPNRVVAVNAGSLGAAADALQFPGASFQVAGALVGNTDTAVHYEAIDKVSFNGGYPTVLPYLEALNTPSFSAEAWVRPLSPSSGNNANVFRNHNDGTAGITDRSGWVVWQLPNGAGYALRLYNKAGSNRAIDLNAAPYTVGQWQHLVVTYDSATRTAKMYSNGALAGTQTITAGSADYVPLSRAEGFIPSFGGFSDGRQNAFIGDMDEVAYYNKVLTVDQVQAHFKNGTNSPARTTPYETLIAADAPVAYYRQNEAAKAQVANLGSLGATAVGTAVNTPISVAGPGAPDNPGFPTNTKASDFNGSSKTYIELNNPAGLNIAGAITLEAWVKPDATQPASAYIIGHGGDLAFNEVFLRIEGGNYQVGDNTGSIATFAVPAGDLGGANWIHLAGAWSNGTWTLYRNGVAVATAADATGPAQIVDANWAIGARGRWDTPGYPSAPSGDQRLFNGAIATAGIYGSALTADRVNAHYQSGVTISPALSPLVIVQQGGTVTLTWTSGTLAQSTDLVNWTDVPNATSGYQTPVNGKQFFRLHD
ncbi:MAG: LamG protein [Akkermansiaceae bacterium]|nr:LamG protein [Akkermansiaceae bacterium]